ncbi:T9SS C-terminal target domain-containing protein [Flavobacterium sp. ANB]|uniref:T9SS C-terminal target domain-containing protein n=1 Tax=unclassified Flavobacterium TaxID=196869 RepID=UPI0012B9A657|nr:MULTISPECIES: T9SS C-terminal target domain-containing protein [unclassified Flavobacterium]MBF4518066.1 T9SS C-terminal target domain-containing protein [Flavobacterium sp. ANB]MTD71190.1 T9SS C-terminal target domain-containing protein [Flavobacterium sp. LC2016-13]
MNKIVFFFLIVVMPTYAQLKGCTDFLSKNYNSTAIVNDGSCNYKSLKIKPQYSKNLSDSIKETSGLLYFDELFWTHNDDHDKTIYGLDSLGKIRKRIILNNAINHDWEEISQDSSYLYIGDFGNNYSGNRVNLQILKIEKKSFLEGNPVIETISFNYSDQTDFNLKKPNTTNFDCEAFIVSKDSIYLFTKQWKSSKTSIYALSKQAGNHIANFKVTLNLKGLVTGAAYLEDKRLVALCGYSKIGKPFIYLLYAFNNHDFLSGNKRKIDLQLSFHQIEGIATRDGLHYYLTNESLVRKPVLNIPQQIHHFDLSPVLNSYLHK